MIPIILFVGKSGSGKTTLMEQVIAELGRRGRRVAAVKHAAHQLELDRAGKDSARFFAAGAAAVAVASDDQIGFYRRTAEPWPAEMLRDRLLEEVDLVLGEGFKEARLPKIAVIREKVGADEEVNREGLLAIATDAAGPIGPAALAGVPRYRLDDIQGLADLAEAQIRARAGKRDVSLYVNGKRIVIKAFIKDFFLNTIGAMVDSLKHTEDARRIVLTIDRPERSTGATEELEA
jgi:molybdopterin-guanine dinucleotide biosynthesis protein MobB